MMPQHTLNKYGSGTRVGHKPHLAIKNSAFFSFALLILLCVSVFFRYFLASPPFSFDYQGYVLIIESLGRLDFIQILDSNLIFPYTISAGVVPVEVGFTLLVKLFSLPGFRPETIYAILASISVALRLYVMRSLKVPFFFIILLNLVFITIFESNALRLGLASSLLLLGLYQLSILRNVRGLLLISASFLFHLQVAFFAVPFVFFYLTARWLLASKIRLLIVAFFFVSGISLFLVQFMSLLSNDKIQEYVERGASGSAGISLTSLIGLLLFILIGFSFRHKELFTNQGKFFAVVFASCVPSLVLLISLTDIAVIGDRAWQLAFLVICTFFFLNWVSVSRRKILLLFLYLLTFVIFVNVLIRYPLSNFFSPPFPEISHNISNNF
ncbi:MAG: hypothetical protein E6Q61_07215 [Nitrosomonas sp.]|nr:MAG: hypothetical protein E6Q61_07215 [Nitrosomonas sp.]